MDETDMTWKLGDLGRRAATDRDRIMTSEEAKAYDVYIKPIMMERATAVIDKYNAEYCKLDLEVRSDRERSAMNYRKSKPKRLKN